CHNAFDIINCEDGKYLCFTPKTKMTYDATFNSPDSVESSYEVCSTVGNTSAMSTFLSWYNESISYSMECNNCQNLFGCVGLKHKKYCIFNKQYTKEAYEKLVPKIIAHMMQTGEWGEYFSPTLSPFGYRETIAQEYFPLGAAAIKQQGWNTFSEPEKTGAYLGPKVILPESIAEVDESICEQILTCDCSGK